MSIELIKFNNDEVKKFILFSKTYYRNNETIDQPHNYNKFCEYVDHKSYHLKNNSNKILKGRAVLSERSLYLNGKKYLATQVTDLLVDQNYKDPMIFINLVKSYNKLNNDFVFHTSNENSEIIYKKFFKFENIINLKAYGFPIKLSSIISKFFNKKIIFLNIIDNLYLYILKLSIYISQYFSSVTLNDCALSEFNEVTRKKFFKKSPQSMERNEKFFKWRFEQNLNKYYYKKILKNNTIVGFLVLRNSSYSGYNVTLLMDLLLIEDLNIFSLLALRMKLINEAISSNNDILFTIINNKNKSLFKVFRFPIIPISDNLLQHSTPIFCSSIKKNDEIKNFAKVHFTLADLDYF